MILSLLDYGSVLIFALTGALVASRAQLDIVGFAFISTLTAVGGGTVRDILLNRYPIFWIEQPSFIAMCVCAAIIVFFTAHLVESRYKLLIWLDSFALAIAVAAGVGIATNLSQPHIIIVIMGILTGTLGGLMRDVVCNEVPLVLKQGELYVSAAFMGALSSIFATTYLGASTEISLLACAVITWALRAGSLAFGWKLPVYKSRAPKP